MQPIILQNLGRIDYKTAWDYQFELQRSIIAHKATLREAGLYPPENTPKSEGLGHFLFCEHPPVYTLGKSGNMAHLLLSEAELHEKSIDFYAINRGGDITFHGLGQVVGYPIFDLELFFPDIGKFVRYVEEAAIRVCADYGLQAHRIAGESGAWLSDADGANPRKICAVGIHLSRWVTMHGFAFNVNTDLAYFKNIVPCGIFDKGVTSLKQELGIQIPENEVHTQFLKHYKDLFNILFVNFDKKNI